MKFGIFSAVFFLLFLFIFSAGCLGDQTTELKLGNESIGEVTITPVYDQLFTNASLDEKVNIKLELFGFVFTKNGVTRAEADEIVSNITDSDGGLNFDFIESSGLVEGNSENSLEEFMEEVFHMPLTNREPDQKVTDIEWTLALSRMQDSMGRVFELINF